MDFEGYERSDEIYFPKNYSKEINYPLVFILHGGGGTAKGLIRATRARFNKLANRDNFVAGYPTWPGNKQNLPKKLVGNTNHDFNGCDEIWSFFKSIIDYN